MQKRYEIRAWRGNEFSRSLSPKLRERGRAIRLRNYLRKRFGIDAFVAPWKLRL